MPDSDPTDVGTAATQPPEARRRPREPWPVAVGVLLAAMIVACVAFWFIAAANPDPVVGDPWQAGSRFQEAIRAAGSTRPAAPPGNAAPRAPDERRTGP
jgi:hypothetical protein